MAKAFTRRSKFQRSLSSGEILGTLGRLKSEESATRKPKLTWGDVAFGLEVARWRSRRFFDRYELLRRMLRLSIEPPTTHPGLLLIQLHGISFDELHREVAQGRCPFLRRLIDQENFRLHRYSAENLGLNPEPASPGMPRENIPLTSTESVSSNGILQRFSRTTVAGIKLMRGLPFVRVELIDSIRIDNERGCKPESGALPLTRVDRILARLVRAARLSPRDYEIWIICEGQSGFALTQTPIDGEDGLAHLLREAIEKASSGGPRTANAQLKRKDEGSQNLRVMTYNIHSCVGLDGKLAPSRIARIIRSFDPDILALQEVDIRRDRSRGEDQTRRLAEELGMHVAFCCTVERPWERYGHALLAKFPIEVVASGLFPAEDSRTEPRGVLLAKMRLGSNQIYVANTHFGLTAADRLHQMQTFLGAEWLGRVGPNAPLMACGDFNMSPTFEAYRLMTDRLRDAQHLAGSTRQSKTFPSPFPMTRIDFIFLSEHFEVEHVTVPGNPETRVASDHLPVIANLRFRSTQR